MDKGGRHAKHACPEVQPTLIPGHAAMMSSGPVATLYGLPLLADMIFRICPDLVNGKIGSMVLIFFMQAYAHGFVQQ